MVKRIGAGTIETEHRTCEHRPHLGVSDAVVLVEALAVVGLPTLTVTARSAFDEDWAVIARPMEFIRRNISEVLADLPEICAAHLLPIRRGPGCLWAKAGSHLGTLGAT